jgi:hypothetical protein
MCTSERRRFRRAGAELDISFNEVGTEAKQHYIGHTVNISPGGLYFQTSADIFQPRNLPQGTLFKVELSIPPTKGLLEFGGKIAGFAKLLRTCKISDPLLPVNCGVALEFCQSPKMSV